MNSQLINLEHPILVVDDVHMMRRIICSHLKSIGIINIKQAKNGLRALKELRDGYFSAIICDWSMDDLDGLALYKVLRDDVRLCNIPFIMVSTHSDINQISLIKEAGIKFYIAKPFSPQEIENKLISALNVSAIW